MNTHGARRTIAMTVWGQRISPVFDAARTLLIAEIDGSTVVGTAHLAFDPERPLELVQMLLRQQVVLVICGAVSEQPAAMLEAAGIRLLPFVAGDVDQVLAHLIKGRALGSAFRMPGCGKHFCCRGKIRRGREIGGRKAGHGAARARVEESTVLSGEGEYALQQPVEE
jgi:predicted Fe-Mo cluster-binding NifX family protein